VCATLADAERAAARWDGPVIIEEFLPGREFVVSLWGADGEHRSIGETLFQGGVRLNTYDAKWDSATYDYQNSPLIYDPVLDDFLRERLLAIARASWEAVGIRGYARIDIRLNAAGEPVVIDLNPNPALCPGAGMHRAITESGWAWEAFVRLQVEMAGSRNSSAPDTGSTGNPPVWPSPPNPGSTSPRTRQ
jgi:D-alanine-D-alanine ligase